MKELLLVCHRFWPHPGGSERLFHTLARRLVAKGHNVTVFTTNAWHPASYHDRKSTRLAVGVQITDGITVRRFGIATVPFQFKVLGALALLPFDPARLLFGHPHVLVPDYLREMFLRKPRFDLVIAGVLPHSHLIYPAARLAKRLGVPWICFPMIHTGVPGQGIERGYLSQAQVRMMMKADMILTATGAEEMALVEHGVPSSKVQAVGVAIDPGEVLGGNAENFRRRFDLEGPIVLQISTQTRAKGSLDLVEAMKRRWQSGGGGSLVLIGQLTREFEDYFLHQGPDVYERTVCLGMVDDQTKRDALAACDMLVMASRADSFGVVYLEAWLYGKPVIGARAGGVPWLVSDREDGLLVDFGDVAGLAGAIDELLDNAEYRIALGERGRDKIARQYNLDLVFDTMTRVVERLAPARGSTG